MKISEQVKRLREKAKMTQRELANRAGVGLGLFGIWSKENRPSAQTKSIKF